MRIPDSQALIMIFIMAAITFFIRVLPFLLFPAIIGMLVVYCLKDVSPLTAPFGLPELLAAVAIVAVHLWKRNTLLSIGGGTLFYMFLVQCVF